MSIRTKGITGRRERGAALILCMVVLLLLTIIAVTGASSSALELLIATNAQNAGEALGEAEDSALAGEQYVQANHSGTSGPAFDFSADNTDGLYVLGGVDVDVVDWTGFATEQVLDGGEQVAEYVVEYIGTAPPAGGSLSSGTGGGPGRYLFRITGRGESAGGSVRLVQTIYATE